MSDEDLHYGFNSADRDRENSKTKRGGGYRRQLNTKCQKPDRQGGQVTQAALTDGRASDTLIYL